MWRPKVGQNTKLWYGPYLTVFLPKGAGRLLQNYNILNRLDHLEISSSIVAALSLFEWNMQVSCKDLNIFKPYTRSTEYLNDWSPLCIQKFDYSRDWIINIQYHVTFLCLIIYPKFPGILYSHCDNETGWKFADSVLTRLYTEGVLWFLRESHCWKLSRGLLRRLRYDRTSWDLRGVWFPHSQISFPLYCCKMSH